MSPDIHWKQRFNDFDRRVALLDEALERGAAALSALEKDGAIRRFRITFEMAWNTLKEFLEDSGFVISPLTPRQVLTDACSARILPDEKVWLEMLHCHSLISHTYELSVFEGILSAVANRYLPAMKALREYLTAKLVE